MIIIQYRKIFFWITGVVLALALGSLAVFGLNVGVDFTGGTLIEARYGTEVPTATTTPVSTGEAVRPEQSTVENTLANLGVTGASVRAAGEDSYIIRTPVLTDEQRDTLAQALSINDTFAVSIERFNEVGPTIGQELRNKAFVALALVMLAIILYVAFTFRHVSKPVSSWYYGGIAILALLHDVLVPVGAFAVLGVMTGAQVDTLFVMALLAILGYSVNDTIVVFDRVRENLAYNKEKNRKEEFAMTVGRSLKQTLTRSINTSITTLLVLTALFFLGPVATQDFALTLMVGVIAGTYSSLCLASPLLVAIERRRAKSN